MKTLTAILFAISFLASTASADPELYLKVEEFDFGWTPTQSTVVTGFWLKSSGTDTLDIIRLVPGIDEIRSVVEARRLAPGDSAFAVFYWTTGDKMGAAREYVTIHTNSMEERPSRVFLKDINVTQPDSLRPIAVKPYRFELSRLAGVSIDSLSFVLANRSERFLRLELVSYPMEQCEIVMPDSLAPFSSAEGYVKVRPDYLTQEFMNSVTVQMSDGPRFIRRLTVPVRRKIFAP